MGWWEQFVRWLEGDRLNVKRRFETLGKLHAGKQSVVYKVKDKKTGRELMLKISDAKLTSDYESRFVKLGKPKEGEIAQQIKQASIIETLEYGETTGGEPFLLMEFFEGRSLQSVIQYYNQELEGKRLGLVRQLAQSVAAVHQANFVHRDICLDNYLLSPDSKTLKLIDFTFTVPKGAPYLAADRRTGRDEYMAPELMKPQEADHRLDIFAMGVTAYQICTGQLPWGQAMGGTSIARAMRQPTDIKKLRPQIAPLLAMAIHSCLLSKPAERCQSADEFVQRISQLEHEDALVKKA